MFYASTKEGEKYEIQPIKKGLTKKGKVTQKSHSKNIDLGEVYAAEGSTFFHLEGSQTFYFTGTISIIMKT